MSIAQFLVVFFVIRYLQNFLQTPFLFHELDKVLKGARMAAIGLLIIEVITNAGSITIWFWHLFLLVIIGVIYKQEKFTPARPVLYAIVPFVFLSILRDLVELVNKDLFEQWDTYFQSSISFAIIWMLALWISSVKQGKTLAQERQKRLAEEENSRQIEQRRAELEHLVSERTAELRQQKEELQQTLSELKATQTQPLWAS
jgi:heme exporter protein D